MDTDPTRSAPGHHAHRPTLERSSAFSDGVFAIAITLLVLPLTETEFEGDDVTAGLVGLLPKIFTFVLSFVVIGRFWLVHHRVFDRIAHSDNRLLTLNLAFLLFVVFLPFPTSLLGEHGDTTAAALIYALNLMAISLMSVTIAWYAGRDRRLAAGTVTPRERRAGAARGLATALGLVPSIPIAFVSPTWAELSWFLIVPFSMVADRVFPDTSGDRTPGPS